MYDNFMRTIKVISYIIYARLSKEEVGKSVQEKSKSIQNQIEICKKFIKEEQKAYPSCQFIEVAILTDDGISGTTFDRDDFKELIKLIEAQKANMVITKDLSRLGRDHIQTDDYIEKWFPEHNVRYVSVMESIDTFTDTVSNDIAPILNWANDNFAKQTSKKIKSTFSDYRKDGKWTGGEIPLGYKKDPKDKYHFIIELKGAEVVKKIFYLALDNYSPNAIADILIKENVPIPTIIKGHYRRLNKDILELWSPDTIKNILQNQMYLGHMVQGKTTRLNYKSKTIVYLPKEQWIVVKNTHEPIISQPVFDAVQLLLKSKKNKTTNTFDYLLKGMIKCKECGRSIGVQHYKNRKSNYTICNYYRKYGRRKDVCTAHRFSYEKIEKAVLNCMKDNCLQYVNTIHLPQKLKFKDQNHQSAVDFTQKIDQCQQTIWTLQKQMDIIYEDKLKNIISEKQYLRMIKSKQEALIFEEKELMKHQKRLKLFQQQKIVETDYSKIVNDFLSLKQPNRIIITNLIDTIYLSEDGVIDIYFRIQKPYS